MNIREVNEKFATDEQCLAYIEKMRWPDGVVRCTLCGTKEVKKYERPTKDESTTKNKRGWFYICLEPSCRNQFSPTSGTVFHDTHLPLIVWFHAIALMLNAKKGISAMQLKRDLGIGGYKTAWYLNHRIREAMAEGDLPLLAGTVEVDETYVGGRKRGVQAGGPTAGGNKEIVMGFRQRGGPVRFFHISDVKSGTLAKYIRENIDAEEVEMVVTDELPIYPIAMMQAGVHGKKHKRIRHKSNQYVVGDVHTNSIESAFSLFKRGIIGSFHKVSIKHLQRYLHEFSYRFNHRKDVDAFIETVRRLCGFKPLKFADLTSDGF